MITYLAFLFRAYSVRMSQFITVNHSISSHLDTILVTINHGSIEDPGFLKKIVGKS
jgi:hypothetical protein